MCLGNWLMGRTNGRLAERWYLVDLDDLDDSECQTTEGQRAGVARATHSLGHCRQQHPAAPPQHRRSTENAREAPLEIPPARRHLPCSGACQGDAKSARVIR